MIPTARGRARGGSGWSAVSLAAAVMLGACATTQMAEAETVLIGGPTRTRTAGDELTVTSLDDLTDLGTGGTVLDTGLRLDGPTICSIAGMAEALNTALGSLREIRGIVEIVGGSCLDGVLADVAVIRADNAAKTSGGVGVALSGGFTLAADLPNLAFVGSSSDFGVTTSTTATITEEGLVVPFSPPESALACGADCIGGCDDATGACHACAEGKLMAPDGSCGDSCPANHVSYGFMINNVNDWLIVDGGGQKNYRCDRKALAGDAPDKVGGGWGRVDRRRYCLPACPADLFLSPDGTDCVAHCPGWMNADQDGNCPPVVPGYDGKVCDYHLDNPKFAQPDDYYIGYEAVGFDDDVTQEYFWDYEVITSRCHIDVLDGQECNIFHGSLDLDKESDISYQPTALERVLSSLTRLTGTMRFYQTSLTSLSFLRNVESIAECDNDDALPTPYCNKFRFVNQKYAITIDESGLLTLGMNRLRRIAGLSVGNSVREASNPEEPYPGGPEHPIRITNNLNLCFADTIDWVGLTGGLPLPTGPTDGGNLIVVDCDPVPDEGFADLVAFSWHDGARCPVGFFADTSAPSSPTDVLCARCPVGTEQLSIGKVSIEECVACDATAGKFDLDGDPATPCTEETFAGCPLVGCDGRSDARPCQLGFTYNYLHSSRVLLSQEGLAADVKEAFRTGSSAPSCAALSCAEICGDRGCWDASESGCQLCREPGTVLREELCVTGDCETGDPSPGWYPDPAQPTLCQRCHDTCDDCTGPRSDECATCVTGLVRLKDQTCGLECPEGEYADDQDVCQDCRDECVLCTGYDKCTKCDVTKNFYLNFDMATEQSLPQCVPQLACPSGTYAWPTTAECKPCDGGCQTCDSFGVNSCLSCKPEQPFFVEVQKRCFGSCPDSLYPTEAKTCNLCSANCATCVGPTKTECLECADNYNVRPNEALALLTPPQKECLAPGECGEYRYSDFTTKACEPCGDHCVQCAGIKQLEKTFCSICEDESYLDPISVSCVDTCPEQYFKKVPAGTAQDPTTDRGRFCEECLICAEGQFETGLCRHDSDRQCQTCTVCDEDEWYTRDCSLPEEEGGVDATCAPKCIENTTEWLAIEEADREELTCLMGGRCNHTVGRHQGNFTCDCPEGFGGKRCELRTANCEPNPCFNDGIHLDGGGGICTAVGTGLEDYTCDCQYPFSGNDCLVNEAVCLNGTASKVQGFGKCNEFYEYGVCEPTETGFDCRCDADPALDGLKTACGDRCQKVLIGELGAQTCSDKVTSTSAARSAVTTIGAVAGTFLLLMIAVTVLALKYAKDVQSNLAFEAFKEGKAIPADEWEIAREHLTLGRTIGEGHFGNVNAGLYKDPNAEMDKDATIIGVPATDVAIKSLKLTESDYGTADDDGKIDLSDPAHKQAAKDFFDEMQVMKQIGKQWNIISLVGVVTQTKPYFIVTEYADKGDLRHFLQENRASKGRPASIDYTDMLSFSIQIASGMSHLSTAHRIVHRDLAARNVLVRKVGKVHVMKVSDFGLARDVYEEDFYQKSEAGLMAIKWMAPEAILDRMFTTKGDVWSFGIVLWEIATLGYSPYPTHRNAEISGLLMEGYRMPNPGSPRNFYDVMLQCWALEEQDRPTFPELRKTLIKISNFTRPQLEQLLGESFAEVAEELDNDELYEDPDSNPNPALNPMLAEPDGAYLVPSPNTSSSSLPGTPLGRGASKRTRESIENFRPTTLQQNAAFDADAAYDMGSAGAPIPMSDGDDQALYDQADDAGNGGGGAQAEPSYQYAAMSGPLGGIMSDGDDQALYDQATDEPGVAGYLDTKPNPESAGPLRTPSEMALTLKRGQAPQYAQAPIFNEASNPSSPGFFPEPAYDMGSAVLTAQPAYEAAAADMVEGMYAMGDEGPVGDGLYAMGDEGEDAYGEVPRAPPRASYDSAVRPASVAEYEPARDQGPLDDSAYEVPTEQSDGAIGAISRLPSDADVSIGGIAVEEETDEIGQFGVPVPLQSAALQTLGFV